MVARPTGILDAETTERIVEFIEIKEMDLETGFNRFCDLTRLEGIRLSSHEVMQLAARRRMFNPNDIRVKSAFFAVEPLAFGLARMYEFLLDSPGLKYEFSANCKRLRTGSASRWTDWCFEISDRCPTTVGCDLCLPIIASADEIHHRSA
jgi:hypothetical protein